MTSTYVENVIIGWNTESSTVEHAKQYRINPFQKELSKANSLNVLEAI